MPKKRRQKKSAQSAAFHQGKKTYLAALVLFFGALAGFWFGLLPSDNAIEVMLGALALAGVKTISPQYAQVILDALSKIKVRRGGKLSVIIFALLIVPAFSGCRHRTTQKHAVLVVDRSCQNIWADRCEIRDGKAKCIGLHLIPKCSRVEAQ